MPPVVSVIIPTHNRAISVARAIRSVLNQTFQDFEIIVVDDASSDNTRQTLQSLQQHEPRLQVICNSQSLGGAQSRNGGIAASSGKWLAFLDDDDTWLPSKLMQQLQALSDQPHAVACSCAYQVNYPWKHKKIVTPPAHITHSQLLQVNCLGGASVCIANAEVVKRMNGFDKKLRSSQDWDFWLRLREAGDIITVNEPLVEYYVHFNYRISNDMRAKYQGARRFYRKYKPQMDAQARRMNLGFICFIQSRQSFRKRKIRFKRLVLAIKNSPPRTALAYTLSSLPRIIL